MSIRKAELMALMAGAAMMSTSAEPASDTYSYRQVVKPKATMTNKQKKARVKSKAARKARRKSR
jgi:hypothetical protein